jgi:hypothetical protein
MLGIEIILDMLREFKENSLLGMNVSNIPQTSIIIQSKIEFDDSGVEVRRLIQPRLVLAEYYYHKVGKLS